MSALILLATIAQLNLPNVFLRFLPAAGAQTRRFVARSHLLVAGLALIVGSVYVLSGLGSAVLTRGWPEQVVFVANMQRGEIARPNLAIRPESSADSQRSAATAPAPHPHPPAASPQ